MVCDSSFLCFSADMHATLICTPRIAMRQYVADVGPRQYQSFSHMVGEVWMYSSLATSILRTREQHRKCNMHTLATVKKYCMLQIKCSCCLTLPPVWHIVGMYRSRMKQPNAASSHKGTILINAALALDVQFLSNQHPGGAQCMDVYTAAAVSSVTCMPIYPSTN